MKNTAITTNITTKLLWAVFVALLLVLLPHTAWLFSSFEPADGWRIGGYSAVAWAAAFAFESAIAVLVHKLAEHWERTPRRLANPKTIQLHLERFAYRWMNEYMAGLFAATCVSALANLAHAVEYGQALAIFATWGIPAAIYQICFGGVLPLVSLLFARVLSNESATEDAPDPALEEAKRLLAELRSQLRSIEAQLRSTEAHLADSEAARQAAEERFLAAGDLFARLFAQEKRQRILAARQQWPRLTAAAIAVVTGCSPSYVSDTLKEIEEVVQ